MNILGNACLKEEVQQESMFQNSQTLTSDGTLHNACNDEPNGSNPYLASESASPGDTPDMSEDLMQGLRESSPQFANIQSENGELCDTPMFIPLL